MSKMSQKVFFIVEITPWCQYDSDCTTNEDDV